MTENRSRSYLGTGSATALWDGTPLDGLETPCHDLGARSRPFPVQRNYFHAAAMRESAQWLRTAVALEQAEYERLLREDVGGFVSWVHPDATAQQLRALCDFHHWAVWLDDLMDRRSTLETSLSACTTLESLGTTELAAFDDFYTRMRTLGMDERGAERFIHAMRRYGTSSRKEVEVREGHPGFTSVADYIANRRMSAAMPVYYALIAWISRIDLTDETRRHPLVVQLENCCSDYSLLYNDAGSFIKEHLAGRSDGTLVRLLCERENLSVQQSLYEVVDMAAAAADDLEAASDCIDTAGLPAAQREQVHRYADGLRKFVGGVNHWSNHTCRYLVGQRVTDTPPTSRAGDTRHLRDRASDPPKTPQTHHEPSASTHWPAPLARKVEQALAAAADELSAFGARIEHYQVDTGGCSALTGVPGSEVFSLEARVGPAHRRPGYTVWAVFQVFDPRQPNLALLRMIERRDSDGLPEQDRRRPLYNTDIDRRLCRILMPVFNRALNPLDPTGRNRSLYATCFHGRVTKVNLAQQLWLALGLFRRFRDDGQAAVIITDFHEPLAAPLVHLARMVTTRDAHLLPCTATGSAAHTLLRRRDGTIAQIGGMSTAVDHGITLARRYLATVQDRPEATIPPAKPTGSRSTSTRNGGAR
ncbi:terpene synthase family protein [Nocardia brasiliensis]|uniref:terpene synthase family protein n=1 Tax=Nocardia brasiliensis TaxID=37326 RepID=UPI0024577932|nr:hypothetical protein [Nocardia brasiliensis]